MKHAWVLALLYLYAFAQVVPSRQYDAFEFLGQLGTPLVDSGFRLGLGVFFSSPDSQATGTSSIIFVEEKNVARGSLKFSSFPFTSTQKFLKGWAYKGNSSNTALMIVNDRGRGYVGLYTSQYGYANESNTFNNCTEDVPPVCYGNVTVITTKLYTDFKLSGNLVTGMDPIQGGQVDWKRMRGYFVSVDDNFTVYTWDLTSLTLKSQIRVTAGFNDTTGYVKRTQISEDGSILYILTTASKFYRIKNINTTNPQIELILKFNLNTPLSFIVSDRWEEALFTSAGFPTNLLWVDLEQKRVYEKQELVSAFSPQVVVKDPGAGYAFVVGFNRPSKVIRVNLQTHDIDSPFTLTDNGRSTNAFLDLSTAKMWIASQLQVVSLRYPGACPANCSNRGTCTFGGICACDAGFDGDQCELLACPTGSDRQICSGNGLCNNGTCACYPGYAGNDCDTYTCDSGCSGHGVCDMGTHICQCDAGWSGSDCATSLLTVCGSATSCFLCSKRQECVWCESNNTCILGDINGPLLQYCHYWHYRSCNWVGFRVVGYIYVGVVFFFLFLNFIFLIKEDSLGPAALANKANVIRSLWVSQRGLQTWIMIEQLQLGALVGYLLPPIPSNLKSFTDAISIVLVSALPAWQDQHLPYLPSRTTQNFLQVGITKGTHPMDLMAGSFFIFLLLLGFNLLYLIIALISRHNMAIWRATHLFLRILQFCQPGLCALGAWTVTQINKERDGAYNATFSIVAAFISIIGLGLIYPLACWLFVTFNKKNLFEPSYRVQFGSLYDTYHHSKLWFGSFNIFKNGAIAMFIGFFADSQSGFYATIMTMLMPILIISICIVTTLIARPFVDKIRGLIQVFMLGLFNIIMFGLCIVYLRFEPYDGWAVAVAAVVGGTLFFTALMWIMNAMRVGPVNKNTTEDGSNAYVRM